MNHDEIQETSTGHVVVSREFRAKIRSKSVPGNIDRFYNLKPSESYHMMSDLESCLGLFRLKKG